MSKMIRTKGRTLDIKEISSLVDHAKKLGAIHFGITGGEPLLDKKVFDVVSLISKKRLLVSLDTNGILLTENVAKRLKREGLDVVIVSIDSPNEKDNNNFRGYPNAFRKSVEAVKNAKKAGLKVLVCSVIKPEFINDYFKETLNFVRKLGVEPFVALSGKVGKWCENENIIFDDKKGAVLDRLLRNNNVRRDFDGNYLKRGCAAGSEKIYVTAYGDVLPCDHIQISFGNIREEELKDIWNRLHNFGYFSKINNKCLPSEDRDFIINVLDPIKSHECMPVFYKDCDFFRNLFVFKKNSH